MNPLSTNLAVPGPSSLETSPQRVRFRSRVRIASGLHKHYSVDSSPASSVSAPLRYQTDESEADQPGAASADNAASLTQVLSMEASNAWLSRMHLMKSSGRKRRERERLLTQDEDERTPLTESLRKHPLYTIPVPSNDPEDEDLGAGLMDEDVSSGGWTERVFNRHVRFC